MRIAKTIFIGTIVILLQDCGQKEEFVKTNSTFYFINNTNVSIGISGGCGFSSEGKTANGDNLEVINSGDTLIVNQPDRIIMIPPSPDINNFELFPGPCFAVYGDSTKCESGAFTGIRNLENYEKRKELSKNNFEFTYVFTEETMSQTQDCN